jgi:hypothetical protein
MDDDYVATRNVRRKFDFEPLRSVSVDDDMMYDSPETQKKRDKVPDIDYFNARVADVSFEIDTLQGIFGNQVCGNQLDFEFENVVTVSLGKYCTRRDICFACN